MSPQVLRPDWTAAAAVRSAMSLRGGGGSQPPFDSLNVGAHVGDEPAAVARNRASLRAALDLPAEPLWLQQVHGAAVHLAAAGALPVPPVADAAVCRIPGVVLAIMVADCLPVLFADADGSVIAAAHAGWRGLAAGVLEATVRAMAVPPAQVSAWLGPAISRRHFEVGDDVLQAFESADPGASAAFERNARGRWQCDLPQLAVRRLRALGVAAVTDSGLCTYDHPAECYSFRRDGRTGRMAALLWLMP